VKPAERQIVEARNDCLQLLVAHVERDVACKVKRMPSMD
jgi:hypothetical protein